MLKPVCLVAALFFAVGCGEIGDADLGAIPTTSTTTASDDGDVAVDTGAVVETNPEVVQPSPPRPDGYEPTLVLSTDAGLFSGPPELVEPLEAPLSEVVALRSADDFFGGLVVQWASGQVLWYPAEGGAGELINDLGGRLLDVGFRDGTPEAILSAEDNAIDRVQLVTRERIQLTVLTEDQSLVDLSAGAGLFALIYSDDSCGGLLFLNSNGEEVDLVGPDEVSCPVPRRPAFGEIALSPDGDAYVYTEITYRSDGVEAGTQLVGREFLTGAELFRVEVGEAGDRIRSVAFDGRRAVMLRSSLDTEAVGGVVVIDTTDPELAIPVDVAPPNGVTFARLPLTVGAPVEG